MMKRITTLFFAVAVAFSLAAQDAYTEAVKAFREACPAASFNLTSDQMKTALTELNKNLLPDLDAARSEQLVDQYLATQFETDMLDKVIVPMMKDHLSIDELKELTATMLTPEGKLYQQHLKAMNEKSVPAMTQFGQSVMQTIVFGGTPKKVEPAADCPDDYRQLFYKYYDSLKLSNIIDQMATGLSALGQNAELRQSVDRFMAYLKDNMRDLYLNFSHGTMTADDLHFGLRLAENTAFQKSMQAAGSAAADPVKVGLPVVMAYMDWLHAQGLTN